MQIDEVATRRRPRLMPPNSEDTAEANAPAICTVGRTVGSGSSGAGLLCAVAAPPVALAARVEE